MFTIENWNEYRLWTHTQKEMRTNKKDKKIHLGDIYFLSGKLASALEFFCSLSTFCNHCWEGNVKLIFIL